MKRIRKPLLALILCSVAGSSLSAAALLCSNSETGWSVWCHTYIWGTTQCSVFDEKGDLIRSWVDGNAQCSVWRQEEHVQ